MTVVLHRCKFVEYQPSSIKQIACAPAHTRPMIAILREDGLVELSDPCNDWIVQQKFSSNGEALCWAGSLKNMQTDAKDPHDLDYTHDAGLLAYPDAKLVGKKMIYSSSQSASVARLFVAGLDGTIIEWDVDRSCIKKTVDSNGGGAVWSMAVSPNFTQLAIGCEDGCVRVYSIVPSLEYLCTLEPQIGRFISIAWSPNGQVIAAGNNFGHVQLWNVDSRRSLGRMCVQSRQRGNLDDSEEGEKVWSLTFMADGATLVSGDSEGHVSFWDIKTMTLFQAHLRTNASDVLTVVAHPTELRVYASGIDYFISEYSQSVTGEWVEINTPRRYHTHDVHSLSFFPTGSTDPALLPKYFLLSGGDDCGVVVDRSMDQSIGSEVQYEKYIQRVLQFPDYRIVKVIPKSRLIVAALQGAIKVWSLGSVAGDSLATIAAMVSSKETTPVEMPPQHLLQIIASSAADPISDFAVDQDGKTLAVCTVSGNISRVYYMDTANSPTDSISLLKYEFDRPVEGRVLKVLVIANFVCFVSDWKGKTVVSFYKIGMETRGSTLTPTLMHDGGCVWDNEGIVCSLVGAATSSDLFLAIGNVNNHIKIIQRNLMTGETSLVPIPLEDLKLDSRHSCLYLMNKGEENFDLIIVTVSNRIYLWDVGNEAIDAQWNHQVQYPFKWLNKSGHAIGITNVKDRIISVYANEWICRINLDLPVPTDQDIEALLSGSTVTSTPASGTTTLPKRKKQKSQVVKMVGDATQTTGNENFKINSHFKMILEYSYLLQDEKKPRQEANESNVREAVIVERPWIDIVANFPPTMYRKRYGGY